MCMNKNENYMVFTLCIVCMSMLRKQLVSRRFNQFILSESIYFQQGRATPRPPPPKKSRRGDEACTSMHQRRQVLRGAREFTGARLRNVDYYCRNLMVIV